MISNAFLNIPPKVVEGEVLINVMKIKINFNLKMLRVTELYNKMNNNYSQKLKKNIKMKEIITKTNPPYKNIPRKPKTPSTQQT